MAQEHFLKFFAEPECPKTYTGLFENFQNRKWSDRPNKCIHGVSYTKFSDAMDIVVGENTLFDMFHGYCAYYAAAFNELHPDWEIMTIQRGNFWNSSVHTFCVKVEDGIRYFADARGITDDPAVFFDDFQCSKNAYLIEKISDFSDELYQQLKPELLAAYEKIYKTEAFLLKEDENIMIDR